MRGRAVIELEEKRKQLLEDAEAMHADALAHTEDLRAHAEREAAQVKLAAEQDAQNMRLGATREVEQARAAADREVTEARRVLAVEKERLAREASENHESATEQTAKLVKDAETRAKAADDRARDIMEQAAKARDAASAEAARLLDSAKAEASQLVSGASSEAQHIRVSATTDAERQTRVLRAEVEELQRKRDGIMAQMGQLRDIVSTFAPTTKDSGPRTRQSRRPTSQEARAEILARAVAMLTSASLEAVETLRSPAELGDRVGSVWGAAKAILETGLKMREQLDLAERIEQLEQAAAQATERGKR